MWNNRRGKYIKHGFKEATRDYVLFGSKEAGEQRKLLK